MNPQTFTPGDRVTWLYEPRGGYGYIIPVNAVVVKVGPKRILIDAPLRKGGTKQVWVNPAKLRSTDGEEINDGS